MDTPCKSRINELTNHNFTFNPTDNRFFEKYGLRHISGFSMVRLMYRALMRFKNPHRLCTHKVLMTDVLAQALAGVNRYCFITAVVPFWEWLLNALYVC